MWAGAIVFYADGNIYAVNQTTPSFGQVFLTSYSVGQWYSVRVDYDYAAKLFDVYIDGAHVGQDIPLLDSQMPNAVRVGAVHGPSPEAWFDDVRVTQIVPPCVPPPSGMISWWPGDNSPIDIAGSNVGTLMGGTTYADGKVGRAFSFDGDGDYVEIPNDASLNPSVITIDMWFYATDITSQLYPPIVKKSAVNDGYAFEINSDDSNLRFWVYVSGVGWRQSAAVPVSTNTWYHAAGTYDGSEIKIFLNGQAQGSPTSASGTINPSPSPLNIGRDPSNTGRFFEGYIDEVEIYSRALTADEIGAIYAAGSSGKCRTCVTPPPDMVSWWPGDNSPIDIAGSNAGTLVGNTTYADGKVGEAFSFDGDGDYVSVGHDDSLNMTNAITVDAWIRPSGTGLNNGIILMKNYLKYGLIWLPGTGKITFSLDIGGWADHLSTSTVPVGEWTHVAGTYDGSNVKIYINGSLDATHPRTGSIATSTGNLTLGYRSGVDEYFYGLIDEVEIFNRALTANEIGAIYAAGSSGKCKGAATYTVTYDGNTNTGGTPPTDGNSYQEGAEVTVLGNTEGLVKTGYTFNNWNTAADGNGTPYAPGDKFNMPDNNVTLYAQWTASTTYTVTYDGNTSTGGNPPTDGNSYQEGDEVTVLGNTGSLVKTGYAFDNWNTAANGSGTPYAPGAKFNMPGNNVTLYAQWTANAYTLNTGVNPGAGGNVGRNPDKTTYGPGEDVQLTATANAGYIFTGWSGDLGGTTNPANVTMDANKNITANFGLIQALATGKASSFQATITKIEMFNDQNAWVQVFGGAAQLDLVAGGLFPGISGLDLAPGTYSSIRVTFKNTFPTAGTLSYGGTGYYTTAATFNGQTNLASTATTGTMAAYTFRMTDWGALNANVVREFAITPVTIGIGTDYQPTLRFTLSNRLHLMGVPGSPDTYHFTHSTPDVRIVE